MQNTKLEKVTKDYAKKYLDYDPISGVFTWKINRPHMKAGTRAGTVDDRGYLRIGVGGAYTGAHRLAWLITYGCWPKYEIDHIDHDKLNNSITNIRDVPHAINMQNRSNTRTGSTANN